jgi:hypothetical protein
VSWILSDSSNLNAYNLRRIAVDGSTLLAPPLDVAPYALAPTPDGGALLFVGGTTPSVEAVDNYGKRRWRTSLPRGLNVADYPRFLDGNVYLSAFNDALHGGFRPGVSTGAMLELSLADGSVGWTAPIPYVFGSPPRPVLDPVDAQLLVFSSWDDGTQSVRLALSDGSQRQRAFIPCHVDTCTLNQAMRASDGTLRLAHDTTDYASGSAVELTVLSTDTDAIFADAFGD